MLHHLERSVGQTTRPVATHTSLVGHLCRCEPARRSLHVTGALGKLEAASASILGSLLATGVVLATEADVQAAYATPNVEVQVVQAPQQIQTPQQQQQLPSVSPTAFDAVLLSIIHATDELSLAADSLLDLTAAIDPTTAGNISMEYASTSNSSNTGAAAMPGGSLHLTPILHQASTAAAALDPSLGHQQQGEDVSTAHRMSRQALAMATEALKLATLLEGQQDGCDPADQELLQQIAAAARLVSVMAADIVQPAGQDAGAPADSGSVAVSSAAASAPSLTAESSTEPGIPGSNSSSSGGSGNGAGLHSFAGLNVLGVQVQDQACRVADLQADILQQCLQL